MKSIPYFRSLSILVIASLLGGCSMNSAIGVKIDNSWQNGDYTGGPLDNILVVGLGKTPANIQLWENTFVNKAAKAGYKATAAYTIFTKEFTDNVAPEDVETVKKKMEEMGYDGVIVGKVRDVSSGPVVEKGETYNVATPAVYSWYNYYAPKTYTVQDQSQIVDQTVVRVETDIYAFPEETLVYTAMIDSVNARNLDDTIVGFVDAVMIDLKNRKMLKKN
jgi:hypothetical protein